MVKSDSQPAHLIGLFPTLEMSRANLNSSQYFSKYKHKYVQNFDEKRLLKTIQHLTKTFIKCAKNRFQGRNLANRIILMPEHVYQVYPFSTLLFTWNASYATSLYKGLVLKKCFPGISPDGPGETFYFFLNTRDIIPNRNPFGNSV